MYHMQNGMQTRRSIRAFIEHSIPGPSASRASSTHGRLECFQTDAGDIG